MAAPRPDEKLRDTSGRGALLVPHVEGNRQEQDCALDDLLGGGGGTHELHAVRHDGHDEATDEGKLPSNRAQRGVLDARTCPPSPHRARG